MQSLNEIERDARNVRKRNLIDENAHVIEMRNAVAFLLAVEIELILKARASTAGNRDTQPLLGAEALLRAHFADHLNCFRGQHNVGQRGVFLGPALRNGTLVAMIVIVDFFRHASKLMPTDSTVKVDLLGRLFPNRDILKAPWRISTKS
jgi:hypothetical protein